MRDQNTRNPIIFGACAVLILLVYQFFVVEPQAKRQRELAAQRPAASAAGAPGAPALQAPPQITREVARTPVA